MKRILLAATLLNPVAAWGQGTQLPLLTGTVRSSDVNRLALAMQAQNSAAVTNATTAYQNALAQAAAAQTSAQNSANSATAAAASAAKAVVGSVTPAAVAAAIPGADVSAAKVAVAASTVTRTLAAHFSDIINAADYGVVCDGTTLNDAAFANVYAAYQAAPGGAEILLPAGPGCGISKTLNWAITQPIRITGMGSGASKLLMLANGQDVLTLLDESYNADITLDNFSISKNMPTPTNGTSGANRGIFVESLNPANNVPDKLHNGQLIISHVKIQGKTPYDTTNGYAAGVETIDMSRPILEAVNVTNFGIYGRYDAGIPTPQAPGEMPASVGNGVGSDFYFHSGPNGEETNDITMINCGANGGISMVDLDSYQGFYATQFNGAYAMFGVREASGINDLEEFFLAGSQINATVMPLYLRGVVFVQVMGNLLSHAFPSPFYQAIYMRQVGEAAISGNTLSAASLRNRSGSGATSASTSVGGTTLTLSLNTQNLAFDSGPLWAYDNTTGKPVGNVTAFTSSSATLTPTGAQSAVASGDTLTVNDYPSLIATAATAIGGTSLAVPTAGLVTVGPQYVVDQTTGRYVGEIGPPSSATASPIITSGGAVSAVASGDVLQVQDDLNGIAWQGDSLSSLAPQLPSNFTGNNLAGIHGRCLWNDNTYRALTVTGNSEVGCGPQPLNRNGTDAPDFYQHDGSGNDMYAMNFEQYPSVQEDGAFGITFAQNVTVGRYYNIGKVIVQDFSGGSVHSQIVLNGASGGSITGAATETLGSSLGIGGSGTGGALNLVNAGGGTQVTCSAVTASCYVSGQTTTGTEVIGTGTGSPGTLQLNNAGGAGQVTLRGDTGAIQTNGSVTASGGLKGLTTQTTPVTVANLAACSASTDGMRAGVTDSLNAASGNFGSTVQGGGTNHVPVYCNATGWLIE